MALFLVALKDVVTCKGREFRILDRGARYRWHLLYADRIAGEIAKRLEDNVIKLIWDILSVRKRSIFRSITMLDRYPKMNR